VQVVYFDEFNDGLIRAFSKMQKRATLRFHKDKEMALKISGIYLKTQRKRFH